MGRIKLAITACHFNRAAYSGQSFEALEYALGAFDAFADAPVFIHVEPGEPKVLAMAEHFAEFGGSSVTIVRNVKRLGCNANTLAAIDHGFASGADAVLHLEDDCPVQADALDYFAWVAERFANDATVATATGYNRCTEMPPPSEWHAVQTREWFHPWTVLTWKDRWPVLRAAIPTVTNYTWDGFVLAEMQRRHWREAYPTLARCDNIGLISSVHPELYPPSFYEQNHKLKVHAGLVAVPPGVFHVEQS